MTSKFNRDAENPWSFRTASTVQVDRVSVANGLSQSWTRADFLGPNPTKNQEPDFGAK